MVFSGAPTKQERNDSESPKASFDMAMGPERSRTLHNFSLPCLKWGGQKHLRCVRVHDGDESSGSGGGRNQFRPLARRSPPTSSKTYGDFVGLPRMLQEPERKRRSVFEVEDSRRSSSRFPSPPTLAAETEIGRRLAIGSDAGIEAVRKKLMLDFQTEMDKMKFAVLSKRGEKIEPPPTKTVAPVAAEERPWNLRTRRAVCKEPNVNGGGGGGKSQRVEVGNSSLSPTKSAMKSPVRRSDVGSVDNGGIKRPREKLSVPLSKHEIEEDFIAITGVRPPRKPKKRSRTVQKQLDTLFPGLWLSEITPGMYKVNKDPEVRKR